MGVAGLSASYSSRSASLADASVRRSAFFFCKAYALRKSGGKGRQAVAFSPARTFFTFFCSAHAYGQEIRIESGC